MNKENTEKVISRESLLLAIAEGLSDELNLELFDMIDYGLHSVGLDDDIVLEAEEN